MRIDRILLLLCLGITFLGLGCSRLKEDRLSETGATLEGTIRYKGDPVSFAQVIVVTNTTSASGSVGEDGKYRVVNVPLGEVKIAVNTELARGDYQSAVMAAGAYKGPEAKEQGKVEQSKVNLKFVSVPKEYWDPNTTPLKTTIQAGANTFDINIK